MGFVYVDDCDVIQTCNSLMEEFALMKSLINSWGSLMNSEGEYVYTRGNGAL